MKKDWINLNESSGCVGVGVSKMICDVWPDSSGLEKDTGDGSRGGRKWKGFLIMSGDNLQRASWDVAVGKKKLQRDNLNAMSIS